MNLTRLSTKERQRLEALVEGALEAPDFFRHRRTEADTASTLSHLARRALMPPRRPALLPAGSVVLGPDFWKHLTHEGGTILGFEEVAVLGVAAACLENAGSVGPYSRVEAGEGEPVLVLHRDFGFGANFDPEDRLSSAWTTALEQLAANDWLGVEKVGPEIRVTRGRRLREEAK